MLSRALKVPATGGSWVRLTMMPDAQQCLIIVPRSEADLYARVREHFAADTRVFVRMDSRTGERASRRMEIFAVGGGDLDPQLRTFVDEQIRQLRKPPVT